MAHLGFHGCGKRQKPIYVVTLKEIARSSYVRGALHHFWKDYCELQIKILLKYFSCIIIVIFLYLWKYSHLQMCKIENVDLLQIHHQPILKIRIKYYISGKCKIRVKCYLIVFLCMHANSVQSSVCDPVYPMDCNPPGSSVHETLQTRTLEWVANALLHVSPYVLLNIF